MDKLRALAMPTGIFGGMPLLTNMSDPRNWAMLLRVRVNALANLILAGPRKAREGIELLIQVRRRRSPITQRAAFSVLQWLERQGEATESEVKDYLSRGGKRTEGFTLARELGLIIEERTSEGVIYRMP